MIKFVLVIFNAPQPCSKGLVYIKIVGISYKSSTQQILYNNFSKNGPIFNNDFFLNLDFYKLNSFKNHVAYSKSKYLRYCEFVMFFISNRNEKSGVTTN